MSLFIKVKVTLFLVLCTSNLNLEVAYLFLNLKKLVCKCSSTEFGHFVVVLEIE